MIIVNCEQRTEEWYATRLGVITASAISSVAKYKSNSESIKTLAMKLLAERLTGEADPFYTNDYMTDGIDREPAARDAFAARHPEFTVTEVGFVYRNDSKEIGCSPDALLYDHTGALMTGVEIKCPASRTHLKYLDSGIPSDYMWQVQFQLYVTGLTEWYFFSYDKKFKEDRLRCYEELVKLDEEKQVVIDQNVKKILKVINDFKGKHNV